MNIKKIYGKILVLISNTVGIDFAKNFDSIIRFHRILNLKHPKTLADKVAYIELHKQSPLAPRCTDKIEVREYVTKKGLQDILIPLEKTNSNNDYYTSVNEIDFTDFPQEFVLKATHGCKMNYVVSDKNKLNINECYKEMNRWLATTYGTYSMEPHYFTIPHRIYVEKYMGKLSEMVDYKIHCLNGIPRFILVTSDRHFNGLKSMSVNRELYDVEWNPIPGVKGISKNSSSYGKRERPINLAKMIEIAKILSADFDFVRVDLYDIDGKIYFGELTFTPASCVFAHFTNSFINEMGKYLKIEE